MDSTKLKTQIDALTEEATGIIDQIIFKLPPGTSHGASKRLVECIVSIALLEFTSLIDAGRQGAEKEIGIQNQAEQP